MSKVNILIVDDSAFMRKSLSIMLSSEPDFEIVGTAQNGLEGYELACKLKPDIVTLDIEMPVMDGLSALKKIMKDAPTSVIMVSSLTTEGADSTLKALELGAVDFISKEMSFVSINIKNIKEDLIKKIKAIHRQKVFKRTLTSLRSKQGAAPRQTGKLRSLPRQNYSAIALGISTGGPLSLQKVIPKLKADINCPIFIVQHMPPKFTKSLSDRLDSMSKLKVKEAENNELVKKGVVYIAPGGFHMTLNKSGSGISIKIDENPASTLHRPSVNVMMNSVVSHYGKKTLGIIMTGMGKDGLEGIIKLKELGGYTIAQDEESCVVYGMPKAIVDAGMADVVVSLEKISETINGAM
ncbi:MAG: chemotaxis response regulator protein-glutamate methylesterase [Melioribacteraceae bacterium]|nr:chemotaxis response regulator protein-glutamate methylesterase [Melioribacteraceae bacterium]